MRLRSGNNTELIPVAFEVGKKVSRNRKCGRERVISWKSTSICDSMIVYTRKSAQKREQWLIKKGPAQPMFLTWPLKKRRTRRQSCCYKPSNFARKSTRLLRSTEPCMLSSQNEIKNSENEQTTVCVDVMESRNSSPQPRTTKRKLDCYLGLAPSYLYQAVDSSYKALQQISWVGNSGTDTLWNQEPEIIQCLGKVGGEQHPATEFCHKAQLYKSKIDYHKKSSDLVDNNVTHIPYVDNSYREKSQALVCLRNVQASALPVQRAESLCSCEKIGEKQLLVVDVSPVAQPFEPNNDRYKTSDRYINDNVDSASTNKASLPVYNSEITVRHNEPEQKRLANNSEPLSPPTPENDDQDVLLVANMVSNLCIHEGVELLKDEQTNLISLEISCVAESSTFGGKDAFEDKTLHLQPKDSLLDAVKEQHDRSICTKKPPSRKPKRKKHQAKVIKETTFVIKSCPKSQAHSTVHSKLPKEQNSRSNQQQSIKQTNKKKASKNFQLRKSDLFEPVMHSNCATYVDILGSSEISRSQTAAYWNDIAMENEYNESEMIQFSEQQKMILERYRKIVRRLNEDFQSLNEDFSRISNAVSSGKTKKARIKDLARQKMHTISETYVENEENGSVLKSQMASSTIKVKGKRSPRKRQCRISPIAENHSGTVTNGLNSVIPSWQSQIKGNPNSYCQTASAKNLCLPKHPHDQGCRIVSQHSLENFQSNRSLLQYGMPIMGEVDVIEERLKNLSLSEEHAYSISDRQERTPSEWKCDWIPNPESFHMAPQEIIPLEMMDELIPSAECYYLVSQETVPSERKDQVISSEESLALVLQETIPFERKDELVPIAESLSLVPYGNFFDPSKINKFRPRVALDPETKRVWNLFMSNRMIEDEEGDQKKLWEAERQRYKNLAEYFIACMRAVQGNRQFSPWKGSVLDSVIGAFLTQNVSDHLSSSAFISLASRFPPVEVNQYDTPDTERTEDIVLDTSYWVSCKVDGQRQEMLGTKADTMESYEGNLTIGERISSQRKNLVVGDTYEAPWPHSPTSDLFTGVDSSNASGESFPNHSSSHYSAFDTNAKADIMPADLPFRHFRSCSESNLTAKVQVNERILRKSCTEHTEETQREVSMDLHEANKNFESSDSDDTLDVDGHLQDSEGSSSKANMSKPIMRNDSTQVQSTSMIVSNSVQNHNSSSQFDFLEESMTLYIRPSQYLESALPDKACEPLFKCHETLPELCLAPLKNKAGKYEIENAKSHLQMSLNSELRASQPNPNSRENIEVMETEYCKSNTIHDGFCSVNSQQWFLNETMDDGTDPFQKQGSNLPGKYCEPIFLQRDVPDLTVQYVESGQGENDLLLGSQSSQNQGMRQSDDIRERVLLQRCEKVPALTIESVENEKAEAEMVNDKFIDQRAQDDIECNGDAQVQFDRGQNAEAMKLGDKGTSVPLELHKDSSTCICFEQDHAHSNSRIASFYRDSASLESLGQQCNSFGECQNSSQAFSYDFFERSSEEVCQTCSVYSCPCSSLTEESQFAASALCSLSQEENSESVPKTTMLPNTPEELNFQLNQVSTPEDTPLTSNWDPVIPKRRRTTKKVHYIKNKISRTTGIARATTETKLEGVKKRLDWESISKTAKELYGCGVKKERHPDAKDAINWDAVRCADVEDIANAIKERGMNTVLAKRIKSILTRIHEDHGCIDLEWLKDIPPNDAKNFLLNIYGLGLKSVECIRLLTLQQAAFPVDTNVGRIVVRLGWVPLKALPENIPFHIIEKYPPSNDIQKYLWPRLCTLDHKTLYELHYQMITFGKVFCTKNRPNCNACPMKSNCKHFASAYASERLSLPAPTEKYLSMPNSSYYLPPQQNAYSVDNPLLLPPISSVDSQSLQNPFTHMKTLHLLFTEQQSTVPDLRSVSDQILAVTKNYEPIIEEPASPEHMDMASSESMIELSDIEDIPTFNLNNSNNTLETYSSYENNTQWLEATGMPASSMALVLVPPEDATIPVPKLKNITRLRTEHHVYEIPDDHQLLSELEPRLPDDPCSYLLAIWSPDKTPETCCASNGSQCEQESCSSCANTRGINQDTVKGTLLIPCRTTMRGRFPLNGTYFQVNEVFADHETSLHPLEVPRAWIWRFHRRKVYFGTSIPSISRGLSYGEIQDCFMKGYVCVRAFDRSVQAPRPLVPRLHFVSSRKDT